MTKNKCAICGKFGSKGWFKLPTDQDQCRHWIRVIQSEDTEGQEPKQIAKSAKICFRHFSINQIDIGPNLVKPRPGKKMCSCV